MNKLALLLTLTIIVITVKPSFSIANDTAYNTKTKEMVEYCRTIEAKNEGNRAYSYPEKYLCNCTTPISAKMYVTGEFTRCEKVNTVKGHKVRNWVNIYFIEDRRCISYNINPFNGGAATNAKPSANCWQ